MNSPLRRLGVAGAVRAETVTAIAATVTAVAALVVAVWDNVQSRNYNQVSVQPHLALEFSKQQHEEGDRDFADPTQRGDRPSADPAGLTRGSRR